MAEIDPPQEPVPAVPSRVARIDRRMLELLACPVTKGVLRYNPTREELVSKAARLAYPIRDGIPIMLASEARQLDEDELG